jgi:hypothetical protein
MIDFIAGFLAGEASFTVQTNVSKNRVYPVLSVIVHKKDKATLEMIRDYFDAGAVYDSPDDCKMWRVNNKKDLQTVVEELDQAESWQVTEKYDQYVTWRRLVELYTEEYHTSTETAIEMAELARDELNVGLGKDEASWNEFINSLR